MKKYFKYVPFLIIAIFVGVTVAYAGQNKLIAPPTVGNTMYSLEDIYNLAMGGDIVDEGTGDFVAGTLPMGETGKSLTDVYVAVSNALSAIPAGGGLPATGQTSCWNTAGDPVTCTGTGQDGDAPHGTALSYTDHSNGTVTDDATSLMWVQDPRQIIPWTTDKGTWSTETEYAVGDLAQDGDDNTFWIAQAINTSGTGTFAEDRTAFPTNWTQTLYAGPMTWADALTNCNALNYGGHDDWRLPNIKELSSLVDFEKVNPAIDTDAFPNTQSDGYWSSTSFQNDGKHSNAWSVDFFDGNMNSLDKTGTYYVRCVR